LKRILCLMAVVFLVSAAFAEAGISNKNEKLIQAAEKGNIQEVQNALTEGAEVNFIKTIKTIKKHSRAYLRNVTALILASEKGYTEIVKLLLDKGADVNVKEIPDGITALMWASQGGYTEIFKLLLEKGADVNAKRKDDRTVLWIASWYGHIDIVKLLVDNGVDVNVNSDGIDALWWALRGGRVEIAKLLLNKGRFDTNIKMTDGSTFLIKASENGYQIIVKLLLEKGADVNIKNDYGETALWWASRGGYTEIVKLLLDKGAKIDGGNGRTALMEASSGGYMEIVKLLLDNGAKINVNDDNGNTALIHASTGGNIIIKFFINRDKNVNKNVTSSDELALLKGWQQQYTEIVELLLSKGADVNAKNDFGVTPLMGASESGQLEIVKLLLDKGADVNAKNDFGITPLMVPLKINFRKIKDILSDQVFLKLHNLYVGIFKLILDKGADVNVKDAEGYSILKIAKKNGQTEIMEILNKAGAKE